MRKYTSALTKFIFLFAKYVCVFIGLTVVHVRLVYVRWLCSRSRLGKRILGEGIVSEMSLKVSRQFRQMCMHGRRPVNLDVNE